MAPYCDDEHKYNLVKHLTTEIQIMKLNGKKIDGLNIDKVLTVNGIRFTLSDGSWGLIRASSNKPSLVIVTESPTSEKRKKIIFDFIDEMLQTTGAVGDYDQKI
jgi:phosphomannomutase/phosphoglucomutase